MNTNYMFKTIIGLGLLIITGYSAAVGNETVFPSAADTHLAPRLVLGHPRL